MNIIFFDTAKRLGELGFDYADANSSWWVDDGSKYKTAMSYREYIIGNHEDKPRYPLVYEETVKEWLQEEKSIFLISYPVIANDGIRYDITMRVIKDGLASDTYLGEFETYDDAISEYIEKAISYLENEKD